MWRRMTFLAIVAASAAVTAPAAATPVDVTLTATNGEGLFDDTLACPSGDGPSWRYGWTGVLGSSALAGAWSSTVEVHDGGKFAFVPAGTGRVSIALNRGGMANFEFGKGDCTNGPLSIATQPDGDPVATGTLPLDATFGTGAVRGLTGSGTAQVSLELGPGADNAASMKLVGDFDVTDPALSVAGATARWDRIVDYLSNRLTVFVTIANAGPTSSVGNAYDVRVTSATSSQGGSYSGLPSGVGTIPSAQAGVARLTLNGAQPGRDYTVNVSIASRDGLDAAQTPVVGSANFRAPLLP